VVTRATGIKAYLKNGESLEKAAAMANHASTSATQLHDRRRDELTLDGRADRNQLAYRHAAVRPSVELLTLRASDRRPRRHAAVGLSIELLALRASDRGLLRRHTPALRENEGLAGRANILGRGHWNEVRSDAQRGEYKIHAKEQEKYRCLPIHYAPPN
jgi:hypothetical protein